MRLLLDTHVWLWWYAGTELDDEAVTLIADPSNHVAVSAASIWEASIEQAIGKLDLVDFDALIASTREDFTELSVDFDHARAVAELPAHHRDPFDRLLVAQSATEGLTLMTRDKWVQSYQVATISV